MAALTDRLDHLLGAKAAAPLAEVFDLHTVEDLLRHYPHRYGEQGQALTTTDPNDGAHLTVIGHIKRAQQLAMRARGGTRLEVELDCGEGGRVDAVFFNARAVQNVLKVGRHVMMSGTVKYWNKGSKRVWNLSHPGYLILPDSEDDLVGPTVGGGGLQALARDARKSGTGVDMSIFDRPLLPVYHASAKLESWTILTCVRQLLDQLDSVDDPLPQDIRRELGLVDLTTALRLVHLPNTKDEVTAARERLRFDEAAALQLVMATRRHAVSASVARPCPPRHDGVAAAFDSRLPFTLTNGQLEVSQDISDDISRPHPMSRLLQGEVGSGKTIVALRAMLQVVDAGMQCAFLAPTEVLAAQHYRSLTTMLGDLGNAGELGSSELATRVVLLTGSMPTAAKREALLAAVTGEAGIVIGTHALIQDQVQFFDLGMVVVDEQHRFGVEQRDALRGKARGNGSPHLLVMTATPIPRTIAMMMLGDLESSMLTELPAGRAPIATTVVATRDKPSWVDRAWARIVEDVREGRQAYVVCSRIGDEPPSDKNTPTTHAAVELLEMLRAGPLKQVRVGLLHGRLPSDEKDAVMRQFNDREIDVLVCTTVVEVGVDVPNATVMVIMDADRFGVSQLHQLRGRIGRGGHQGLCLMISNAHSESSSMMRLNAVASTLDGNKLAQLDLQQRREGDVLGVHQSGTDSTLKLLSLLDDIDVIAQAQVFAREVVAVDPDLSRHPGLASMMRAAVAQDRVEYLTKL